jgi:hypothetical protein
MNEGPLAYSQSMLTVDIITPWPRHAGICPDDSCTSCTGGEVIPTTAIPGFPPGSLTCGALEALEALEALVSPWFRVS